MAIHLPSLADTFLHGVSTCGYIEHSAAVEAIEAIKASGRVRIETEQELDGALHLVRLIVDVDDDDDLHVHADLARGELAEIWKIESANGQSLADWQSAMHGLHGVPIKQQLSGMYSVPWPDVPNAGIVKGLSEISTTSGGATLSLNGAEITVSGSDNYRKIRWSRIKDNVRGEVSARVSCSISDSYLDDAVKLLDVGVRRFLLEQDIGGE